MDIASISAARSAASLIASRSSKTQSSDPVTQAFQKADKRVQQQRERVSVELSSFGKLKSSFSDVQTTARALGDSKQTATDADIKKVAGNFVKAFNNAAQTARSATSAQATLADNSRARAAQNDLRRSINTDAATTSDLKKIGITRQQDGTLAIDEKKFDAELQANPEALRGTLSKLGQQVDRTATRELAANGNIGRSVNTLESRARTLDSRQTEQQAQAAAAQQAVTELNARLDANVNPGIAAYLKIFSI